MGLISKDALKGKVRLNPNPIGLFWALYDRENPPLPPKKQFSSQVMTTKLGTGVDLPKILPCAKFGGLAQQMTFIMTS